MSDDVVLPGTGISIETLDVGGTQRQVITVSPRDGTDADSIGALNEPVPVSDTDPSGLNGRLQRIAQNLTTLINISPNIVTVWTQTVVTLSAATSATLVAANANRVALKWMVTGTNPMTVAPGQVTVTVGNGMNYSAPSSVGNGGGHEDFLAPPISQQAYSAISTLGTTVVVWEGVPAATGGGIGVDFAIGISPIGGS